MTRILAVLAALVWSGAAFGQAYPSPHVRNLTIDGTVTGAGVGTTAGTVAAGNDSRIVGALQGANNLTDVGAAATARVNLGIRLSTGQISTETSQQSQSLFVGLNAGAAYPLGAAEGYGSTGFGTGALQSLNTVGLEETAVGQWACQYVTSGNANTCIGMHAGGSVTTEGGDTLVGNDAMRDALSVSSGGEITAVGNLAVAHGNIPQGTVGVGFQALSGNSGGVLFTGAATAGDVITVGITSSVSGLTGLPVSVSYTVQAGDTLSTIAAYFASHISGTVSGPSYYILTGYAALPDGSVALLSEFPGSSTSGWSLVFSASGTGSHSETMTVLPGSTAYNTTAIGFQALRSLGGQATNGNTAVGALAGTNNTTGQINTFIGAQTGMAVTTGGYNSLVGSFTGVGITTGYGNTFLGASAGTAVTSGFQNTIIGQTAGGTLTTGAGNIIIGVGGNADVPTGSSNNMLVIRGTGSTVLECTNISTTPQCQFYGPVQMAVVTVSALPACNTALKGATTAVSDATSPTYNGTLTGGGAVSVPAYCNGTAWTAH